MKSISLRVACLSLFLLCGAAMFAGDQPGSREIKLEDKQGITQALKKSGCNTDWLSYVMRQKDIKFSKLRHLPLGTSFSVPANCATEPSKDISSASHEVIKKDARRVPFVSRKESVVVNQVNAENSRLKNALDSRSKELESMRSEMARLKAENATLALQKAEADSRLSNIRPTRFRDSLRMLGISMLGVFIVLSIATLLALFLLKKSVHLHPAGLYFGEVVNLKRLIEVEHNGQKLCFKLAAYVEADDKPGSLTAYYKCPLCDNGRIKEHNINRHLSHQHAAVIEVVEKKFSA